MRISLIDRSLYYKSLMLLIRKDHEIHDEEKKMMMHIGEMLGFDLKFCANTIAAIMENCNIIDSPPHFSETKIALHFIRDGLRLSAADGQIHDTELAWLQSVAESNGLSNIWAGEVEKFQSTRGAGISENSWELSNFEWE